MFYILGVFFKVGRQSVGESVIKGPDENKNDVDARKRYDSMEEYLTRGTRVLLMSKAWAVSYCTSGFFCGIRLFFNYLLYFRHLWWERGNAFYVTWDPPLVRYPIYFKFTTLYSRKSSVRYEAKVQGN